MARERVPGLPPRSNLEIQRGDRIRRWGSKRRWINSLNLENWGSSFGQAQLNEVVMRQQSSLTSGRKSGKVREERRRQGEKVVLTRMASCDPTDAQYVIT